jgi:hypothetical protein
LVQRALKWNTDIADTSLMAQMIAVYNDASVNEKDHIHDIRAKIEQRLLLQAIEKKKKKKKKKKKF